MDHCIDGRILFPATGYLCLAWKMLARALSQNVDEMPVVFEDVTFHQAVILPKTGEAGGPPGEDGSADGRPLLLSPSLAVRRDRGSGSAPAGGFPLLRGV